MRILKNSALFYLLSFAQDNCDLNGLNVYQSKQRGWGGQKAGDGSMIE